ncbi:MAG: hypothetical protein GW854_01535 [Erythrobacter sp.]|nr:hypothetical protein [Erythrobacter sp.]
MFAPYPRKLLRWRTKEKHPEHNRNFVAWHHYGYADQAWGLDEYLVHLPAVSEKINDTWFFRDPRGKYHRTIRDLFSAFRLRRSRTDDPGHIERMHQTLAAIDAGLHASDPDQMIGEIFDGSRAFFSEYLTYLEVEQIIEIDGDRISHAKLSIEGSAILLMLERSAPGSDADCTPDGNFRRMLEAHPNRFKEKIEDIEW